MDGRGEEDEQRKGRGLLTSVHGVQGVTRRHMSTKAVVRASEEVKAPAKAAKEQRDGMTRHTILNPKTV